MGLAQHWPQPAHLPHQPFDTAPALGTFGDELLMLVRQIEHDRPRLHQGLAGVMIDNGGVTLRTIKPHHATEQIGTLILLLDNGTDSSLPVYVSQECYKDYIQRLAKQHDTTEDWNMDTKTEAPKQQDTVAGLTKKDPVVIDDDEWNNMEAAPTSVEFATPVRGNSVALPFAFGSSVKSRRKSSSKRVIPSITYIMQTQVASDKWAFWVAFSDGEWSEDGSPQTSFAAFLAKLAIQDGNSDFFVNAESEVENPHPTSSPTFWLRSAFVSSSSRSNPGALNKRRN